MTANSRNGMRPTGRSPPFLAIGLTVALIILGFNYWSLSARNGEQANEIAVLESEMRLMNAKKISAEKRGEAISDKVKDLESELSKQKAVVADKMSDLANIGNELDRMKQESESTKTELQKCEREKLPAILKEKDDLQMELNSVKEALERAKQDTVCDESKCSTFSQVEREKLLDEISRALGLVPLVSLYKNGVNVGKYEEQVKQLAAQRPDSGQPVQAAGQPIVNVGQALPQQSPLDQQQQQAQQPANPGAQPPGPLQPQNAPEKNPNVVEQEFPQVPNPNDGQAKADPQLGENNPQKDENDRIQPDQDVKLDQLDTDNDRLPQDALDARDQDEDNADDVDDGDYDNGDEDDDDIPPNPDENDDAGDDLEADDPDQNDDVDDTLRVPADKKEALNDLGNKEGNFDRMRDQLEKDMQQ